MPDTQEPNGGVGLSNPELSTGSRRLLDLINRLTSTGVQVDIDLPQIAVIGSQSAGKSSLIESISGITLPRAAGTCTRCPTECKLSRSSDPWKCIVSLRFTTDARGRTLGQARNETFGAPIFNKAEVEDRLRRAQLAILNPSKSFSMFLENYDDGNESELTFSTNCVSLQIIGPDVADLSFCDLPGLIASVSQGGNEADIGLVQNLVTSYISRPNCIILLTVACETDFENQGAHRLAKINDPQGKRTIGVLTKPDRIAPGNDEIWIPFIRNEKEPLKNNWYCVKQPDTNALKQGITWTEARRSENEFFSLTPPWSKLDHTYQKYLRTSNLTERLSEILSSLIAKRLPEIQQELANQLQKTQELLRELPPEPSQDPFAQVLNLISGFTADLGRHLEGIPDDDGLIQSLRSKQDAFRRTIRRTAPDFRPYERRFESKRSLARPHFLDNENVEDVDDLAIIYDEDEDTESTESTETQEYDSGGAQVRPTEARDDYGSEEDEDADAGPANETLEYDSEEELQQDREDIAGPPIYIDEVMRRARKARTRELPGNYPFVVQKEFISAVTKQWHEPAKLLCGEIYTLVDDYVRSVVNKHFHEFRHGGLKSSARLIMSEHVKRAAARTEEKIKWLIHLEDRPFTLNTHYLADYKSKFISHYRGNRNAHENNGLMQMINSPDSSSHILQGIPKALASLAEIGLHGIKRGDLPKLLPVDQMDPAISIMADVRAYVQVAYKRFVDNVPLAIDHELVLGINDGLTMALYQGLGITGSDPLGVCKELVAEDPRTARRREELLKKQERLAGANRELMRMSF